MDHPHRPTPRGIERHRHGPSFNPCCRGSPSPTPPRPGCPPAGGSCFNPCCRGSPSPTGRSRPGVRRTRRCFNPCCRGSPSPTGRAGRGRRDHDRVVSILVVVDHPHRRGLQHQAVIDGTYVSILVVVDHLTDIGLGFGDLPEPPGWVSILVVVDHPHRRGPDHQVLGQVDPVSILVVVDHPHRRDGAGGYPGVSVVSILVVVDHPHRQFGASVALDAAHTKFQSLLSWITLTDSVTGCSTTERQICFNPCCRGSPSPTLSKGRNPWPHSGFNPCCSGSPSPTCGCRSSKHGLEPVSILVVVDHPQRRLRPGRGSKLAAKFQSLLSWITLTDRVFSGDSRRPGVVSILVVVDHPHRHPLF